MTDRLIVTFALLAGALFVACTLILIAVETLLAMLGEWRQRRARRHPPTVHGTPVDKLYEWDGHL